VSITGVVSALVRRWYLLAIFAFVTAVTAVVVPRAEGVYWTQVSVVFLAPVTPLNPNALTPTPAALVNFAAAIERGYNGSEVHEQFAAPSATLFGAGVREGAKVALVNAGGQWTRSYSDPVLVVDVVDSSEMEVRAEVRRIVADIERLAQKSQSAAGVPSGSEITTLQSPAEAPVGYTEGNRPRAMAGILALGALVGTAATLLIDTAVAVLRRRAAK
jgi:hypothetical protein